MATKVTTQSGKVHSVSTSYTSVRKYLKDASEDETFAEICTDNGKRVLVNPDLIESVEEAGGTAAKKKPARKK